jgi:thioredoxin 1
MREGILILLLIAGCLGSAQEIGEKELNSALNSGKPVVLYFYAEWCAVCKQQEPIIQGLKEEYDDKIVFLKLNADENRKLLARYSITGTLPTIVVFNQSGGVKTVFIGFTEKSALKEALS